MTPILEQPTLERGSRATPTWTLVAAPLASLSTFLAWSVVTPLAPGDPERVAIVSASSIAVVVALAVLGAGAWLHRRSDAAPLWLLAASLVPWLPLSASGALLLWHGPAALVPVGAAALLVTWPLLARVAEAVRARSPRQQAALAFFACAVLYGLAGWRMQPQLPGGDEPHYLVITQSLLLDHDLRIENNHLRGDYRAYTAQELKPDSLKRGTDGQIYSIHAPGTSVLVLPAFALAGYPGVVAWLVLLAAIGAALAWWASWQLTADAGAAWIGWAVVALSAPFLFESFAVFPDGPGAVLVMACVCALVTPSLLRTTRGALAFGGCAAVLPWLHTRYAIVAGVVGVLVAIRLFEHRPSRVARLAAFLALPVVSAAAWFWFFHAIYGTFNPAAPYGGYTQSALSNAPRGLTGLLLDQQFGILPNAPAYAVALVGMAALWRLCRRLALELVALVFPYVMAVACYHMWWGGRSAPARFVVPVLLPLALPAAAFWQRSGRTGRAFAGAAILASVAIACGVAWIDRGALAFNVRDGYALWLDALAPLVRLPLALPSLFRGTPGGAWAVGVVWMAAMAAIVSVVHAVERARASRNTPIAPGPFRTVVAGAVLLATTVAASLGWAVSGGDAVDPGSGLVRVVCAAEAPHARAWRSSAPAVLEAPGPLASSMLMPTADRRPTDPAAPAWTAASLPPGRYEIHSASGLRVSGRLSALVGRDTVPVFEATLHDASPGVLWVLDLPAGAASPRILADPEARRTAGTLQLRQVHAIDLQGRTAGASARAVLQGRATAWFVDGNAWVEPGGFWVRGGAATALVVDGKGTPVTLVVRAGPVAATATVTVAAEPSRTLALEPGRAETVVLPGTPVAVRIGCSSGFRPRDHDPANHDSRWLGVRVELR